MAAISPSASAEPRGVLVLPLEHDGLDLNLAKNLDRIARERVTQAMSRYKLMPTPALEVSDLAVAAGCSVDVPSCFATIGKTVGAARVVRIQVQGTAERARLTTTVVEVRSKAATPYTAKIDDLGPDAYEIFGWHVETGVGGSPAPLFGKVALLTEGGFGSLDGAQMLLDDQTATLADLDALKPGEHLLVIRQRGFETIRRRLEVEGGRTMTVRVKFVPVAESVPAVSPPIATAPPPTAPPPEVGPPGLVTHPDDEDDGSMVMTWVLGIGTGVAAATAGGFGISVLSKKKKVNDSGTIDCYDESNPVEICTTAVKHRDITNVMWGVTAALGIGTVIAFFIENPIGGDADGDVTTSVSLGFAPSADGASAAVNVRF